MKLWSKIRHCLAVVCAFALLAPPAEARNKKGDKLMKAGAKAESVKDYDAALAFYDQAVAADPNEPGYLLADQRMRTRSAEAHEIQGRTLRADGKLDESLVQFQKAFLADPSSSIALQNIRDTTAMIKQRNAGPPGAPVLTPAQRSRQDTERRINALEGPPMLRPINAQISSLKMNNQPVRVLYQSVGKLAGINVLYDPSGIEAVAGKNFDVDFTNVSLEEALNYIALETHTFWKPISANAIFVTQESDPKRQEYQDEVVKVFYIQNASTVNEFQEIFNGVRTVGRLTQGVFAVPTQNAIVARGSVDTMALVEKLVHDLDHPKAEVVIDVIVMSVNKTKTTNIGASLLGAGGFSQPLTFTPRNAVTTGTSTTTSTGAATTTSGTTSTSSGTTSATGGTGTTGTTTTGGTTTSSTTGSLISLAQAGHLSSADFTTSFPSTVIQALLSDSTTRILQRPQVRSTDGGKAMFMVGSSIPYVSGSLSSVVTTGSTPYATTQFQQVNVGTQIEFSPHVNGGEDISMHVKVELSNVLQQEEIAGVNEPIIGKQVDEADIRMKDGEVSVLGGLSDIESNSTISGLPGFTSIPGLDYLFGNKNKTKSDNQILIAMIPHIVRSADNTTSGDVGVFAGTERVVRVERHVDQPKAGQAGVVLPVTAVPSPLSPAPVNPAPATIPPSVIRPPATSSPLSPSTIVPIPPPVVTNPNAGPPDPIGSSPSQSAQPRVVAPATSRPPGSPPDPVGSSPPPGNL